MAIPHAMDITRIRIIIFLDFKKEFDLTDHNVFLTDVKTIDRQ